MTNTCFVDIQAPKPPKGGGASGGRGHGNAGGSGKSAGGGKRSVGVMEAGA